MDWYQSFKEPLGSTISAGFKVNIKYISVQIHGAPQIVLLGSDLYEDFINVECVAVALMAAFQSTGVFSSELDGPESDGIMA